MSSDGMKADQEILQTALIAVPRPGKLPGMSLISQDEWLLRDEAYDRQMLLRDHLLSERRPDVFAALDMSAEAQAELLGHVLRIVDTWPGTTHLPGNRFQRPDGTIVDLSFDRPLITAARLVQEDLCLLMPSGDEHILAAAVLCFPASWTLAEKMGKPLIGIHEPVEEYNGDLAKRVQRLFDRAQTDRPMVRYNLLAYPDAVLFRPRSEKARRTPVKRADYLRSERQCVYRLPKSSAVVFSIHTTIVRTQDLGRDQHEAARSFFSADLELPPRRQGGVEDVSEI